MKIHYHLPFSTEEKNFLLKKNWENFGILENHSSFPPSNEGTNFRKIQVHCHMMRTFQNLSILATREQPRSISVICQ
jgi:hypothetical protein